jgi:Na+-transporting methylmalonyl-CoA/oxaloacetate decarboxylase gamma subunit
LNEISQGVQISITGLTITFLALGVFILVMLVLQKLFPPKPQAGDDDEDYGQVIEEPTPGNDNGVKELEIAAAISAAVSYFQSRGQSQLGKTLQEGRGAWWMSNRLSSRQSPGKQTNRSVK